MPDEVARRLSEVVLRSDMGWSWYPLTRTDPAQAARFDSQACKLSKDGWRERYRTRDWWSQIENVRLKTMSNRDRDNWEGKLQVRDAC